MGSKVITTQHYRSQCGLTRPLQRGQVFGVPTRAASVCLRGPFGNDIGERVLPASSALNTLYFTRKPDTIQRGLQKKGACSMRAEYAQAGSDIAEVKHSKSLAKAKLLCQLKGDTNML